MPKRYSEIYRSKIRFIIKFSQIAASKGISENLLEEVNNSLGFTPLYHAILFEKGLSEIVRFCEDYADLFIKEQVNEITIPLSTTQKIALMLEFRILNSPFSLDFHKSLSVYYAKPLNIADGITSAWRTADVIWRLAGDESVDINFYTKRSLLSGVFMASQYHYHKTGEADSVRKFIIQALEEVVNFGKITAKCKRTIPTLKNLPFLRVLIG